MISSRRYGHILLVALDFLDKGVKLVELRAGRRGGGGEKKVKKIRALVIFFSATALDRLATDIAVTKGTGSLHTRTLWAYSAFLSMSLSSRKSIFSLQSRMRAGTPWISGWTLWPGVPSMTTWPSISESGITCAIKTRRKFTSWSEKKMQSQGGWGGGGNGRRADLPGILWMYERASSNKWYVAHGLRSLESVEVRGPEPVVMLIVQPLQVF